MGYVNSDRTELHYDKILLLRFVSGTDINEKDQLEDEYIESSRFIDSEKWPKRNDFKYFNLLSVLALRF